MYKYVTYIIIIIYIRLIPDLTVACPKPSCCDHISGRQWPQPPLCDAQLPHWCRSCVPWQMGVWPLLSYQEGEWRHCCQGDTG